jgi:glycosyltransferase involved in cell wall biosynthesis
VTSTHQPLVSVIIPTYNYAGYIADALESILAQTVRDFEVLVVDDGSTDNTREVVGRFTDARVRLLRKENGGTASARNAGRKVARGAYIAWLDADDLWRPVFLERMLTVLEAEPEVGHCFSDFVRTEQGKELPGSQFSFVPRLRALPTRPVAGGARVIEMDPFAALAPSTSLPGWLQASVFRRATLEGRWSSPHLKSAEDLYLILQVYAGGKPIAFLDEVLVEVRRHGKNSYVSGDYIQNATLQSVLAFMAEIPLTDPQRAILRRRIAAEHCALGWRYFWQHDAGKAVSFYGRALLWPGRRLSALAHLALLPVLPLLPRREPTF